MDVSKFSFTVHGPKNPATVALEVVLGMNTGIQVDAESFHRVEAICGDVEGEGFVIQMDTVDGALDGLQKLCALGRFSIVIRGGGLTAVHESEDGVPQSRMIDRIKTAGLVAQKLALRNLVAATHVTSDEERSAKRRRIEEIDREIKDLIGKSA